MRPFLCEQVSRHSKDLLVAGTNTAAGKNLLMCALLRAAKNSAVSVKPFKPLEIDNFHTVQTSLSPGMHQKAFSAGVPVEGSMCPFWIVYDWSVAIGPPDLYLFGEHKGRVVDNDLTSEFVREQVRVAVTKLKSDGSQLIIEAPGAFSECFNSDAVAAVLDVLDPDIVLVGDFLRGGGLASLIGTFELLPEKVRSRVIGVVLNHLDDTQGDAYPQRCNEVLRDRFGVGVLGMMPTWREGFNTISEDNPEPLDSPLFDAQLEQLVLEIQDRLHPHFMGAL